MTMTPNTLSPLQSMAPIIKKNKAAELSRRKEKTGRLVLLVRIILTFKCCLNN